jgi:hypothetical protein
MALPRRSCASRLVFVSLRCSTQSVVPRAIPPPTRVAKRVVSQVVTSGGRHADREWSRQSQHAGDVHGIGDTDGVVENEHERVP